MKVYDCSSFHKISNVSRPKSSAEKFHCHISWKDEYYLLMAWGSTVKIGLVKEKAKEQVAPGWPSRYMEIISVLEFDYVVCGIVPFYQDYAVLAHSQTSSALGSFRPEIRVLKADGEEISSDALSISGFEELSHIDYRLGTFSLIQVQIEGECLFYIASPKEIILCKPRDIDDHISWLIEHEKFDEALLAVERGAEERSIITHSVAQVGDIYLQNLFKQSKRQVI